MLHEHELAQVLEEIHDGAGRIRARVELPR